jgi:hypothetical protein
MSSRFSQGPPGKTLRAVSVKARGGRELLMMLKLRGCSYHSGREIAR